jgi:hypothetical protein
LRQAIEELEEVYSSTTRNTVFLIAEYPLVMEGLGESASENRVLRWLMNEPEVSRRVVPLVYANWLSQIDRPRHVRTAVYWTDFCPLFEIDRARPTASTQSLPPEEIETFLHRTLLVKRALPDVGMLDNSARRELAGHRALLVTLASQLHYRAHGRLPKKLEELTGGYFRDVPIDPYCPTGAPLHYRRDGDDAIVWSIGENGTDDGGDIDRIESYRNRDFGVRIEPPK